MIILINIPQDHYTLITHQKVISVSYRTADQIIRYFDGQSTPQIVMKDNLNFALVYGVGD